MNRKWIALLLSCLLVLTMAAACGRRDDTAGQNDTNNGANNGMNNGTNNGMSNGTNNGMSNGTNNGNPDSATPGNDLNGNTTTQGTGNASGMNDTDRGEYPTFPNSLADANADVALDDLIATLGLTATDLDTAMRDVSTVGDGVEGARTYRHKLLGHEADVSYGMDDRDTIDRITVKTGKERMEDWRTELNDTLGATGVEGQADTWDYSDSRVKITEQDDHLIITIEKPKG